MTDSTQGGDMGLLIKRFLRHNGRKLYFEELPDDFIVYKSVENHGTFWRQKGAIKAKEVVSNCCNLRPVKYFPDAPKDYSRWWLICPSCKHAIKANGDAV